MNIVMMGGSFNPPTIAHLRLIQTAMDAVEAEMGFLVPVSFPYLKRKMVKAGQSHLCFSDEQRIRMIEMMTARDGRIRLYTDAMMEPFSDDIGIMKLLQDRYPDSTLYYIAGTDKLDLLEIFARKSDFFERFRCILYARESGQLEQKISAYEHLADCLNAFVPVSPPEGTEGISSTAIREHLFDIDAVADMIHPDVREMLRGLKRDDFPEEILRFRNAYAFLANDYPAEVIYEGVLYPCALSAFLGSGRDDPKEKEAIARMNPAKAKQRYNAASGTDEWKEHSIRIMEEIVRLKFMGHPELMDKLILTGNRRLINGGKDTFWGINPVTWEGENHLGQILMKVRTEGMQSEVYKGIHH